MNKYSKFISIFRDNLVLVAAVIIVFGTLFTAVTIYRVYVSVDSQKKPKSAKTVYKRTSEKTQPGKSGDSQEQSLQQKQTTDRRIKKDELLVGLKGILYREENSMSPVAKDKQAYYNYEKMVREQNRDGFDNLIEQEDIIMLRRDAAVSVLEDDGKLIYVKILKGWNEGKTGWTNREYFMK